MDARIIAAKLDRLRAATVIWAERLSTWDVRIATYHGPGQYEFDGNWMRAELPCSFEAGRTVFFRGPLPVPKGVPLADTYLEFQVDDLDGLLSLDGRAYAGIDVNHRKVLVPNSAAEMAMTLEFISVPWAAYSSETAKRRGTFSCARICVVDREIEALYHDLWFAWETSKVIADDYRKQRLARTIESAMLALDLTATGEAFRAEIRRSGAILRNGLAEIPHDRAGGRIFATGHSHIDIAWLWPVRESVRKAARTFATACRLMERYPDFHFACSQVPLYQFVKTHHPGLYDEVKKWVSTGRWETTGAMWLEADCIATSGESLIRQILYGLRFFREEFGTQPRTCWLPDVFGYPASLPEILKGCGIDRFFTCKLHWQATNSFPHHLFRWRGLDGSEIIAHIPRLVEGYNGTPTPAQLLRGWDNYRQKVEYSETLFPFGHGDGGGGVTEGMMEMIQRAKGPYPGLPALRTGPSEQYFDEVVPHAANLPLWDGELYLETHRGTYTTQGRTKRANRKTELLFRDAEIVGSLASLEGAQLDWSKQRRAWERLLLCQFHDILPGSSIPSVYVDAEQDFDAAQRDAAALLHEGYRHLFAGDGPADHICLFNTLSWTRTDVVTAEIIDSGAYSEIGLVDPQGQISVAQIIGRTADRATVVFEAPAIPSIGYSILRKTSMPAGRERELKVSARQLETPHFIIELTEDGAISRLYDKLNRREVLAAGQMGNELQLLQDGPEREDAWNVHATSDARRYPFEGEASLTVVECGLVRGVVRVRRRHRASIIEQDIVVYAAVPRIDFVTHADWHEKQVMLKAAFPLLLRTTRATYEVQFGSVERATHRNTSWDQEKFEVPAHRWADLSEPGYGVSLLNDCKYGYDAKDNVLRLTLLRGTTSPDPHADEGRHEFTYSLFPHAGDWHDCGTVRRAWELNVPVRAESIYLGQRAPTQHAFVELSGVPAIIEAIKPAEQGPGLIVRIYEPHGSRGTVTVTLDRVPEDVVECNLAEDQVRSEVVRTGKSFQFEIKPFQIRTFILKFDSLVH